MAGFALMPLPVRAAAADDDDDRAPHSAVASHADGAAVTTDDDDGQAAPATQVTVAGKRLDAARATIDSSLGAATYTLSNDAVERRPGGETVNLGQVLLQAPGVTQDGAGQLRMRGQGDLEYRINNVIIPESFGDVGDSISARLVDRVQLVTGALPAQYGLHAGGVVNITTKSGAYDDGGQAELYGGSHGTVEPAFEYAGARGPTNIFISASDFRSDVGLGAPEDASNPVHDATHQVEGFAYLDRLIDDRQRVSLILGSSTEQFQLPYAGLANTVVRRVTGGQRQNTQYGIAGYEWTGTNLTLQTSVFARYTSLNVDPDPALDLEQNGRSLSAKDRDTAAGLQVEGVYQAGDTNSIRSGFIVTADTGSSHAVTTVLGRDGIPAPATYLGHTSETRWENSLFIQDEWQLLPPLTLNYGLRLDSVTGPGGGTRPGPRLSLVWNAARGVTVHAGYARYFIPAPDTGVGGATAFGIGATMGAAAERDLRPETDDTYDVGAQKTWRGLAVGLDGYWRKASDLIAEQLLGPGTLMRPFNFAHGRLYGIETSVTYTRGAVAFWANLGVARAEGKAIASGGTGLRLVDVIRSRTHFIPLDSNQGYTASAGVSYRWQKLQLSTDITCGSGFSRTPVGANPDSGSLGATFQLNLAAVYRVAGLHGRPLDLRVDLINALDRRNEISDGTSVGGGVAAWGPRRGLFAGLEQSF